MDKLYWRCYKSVKCSICEDYCLLGCDAEYRTNWLCYPQIATVHLVVIYQTAWRHVTENSHLRTSCRENQASHNLHHSSWENGCAWCCNVCVYVPTLTSFQNVKQITDLLPSILIIKVNYSYLVWVASELYRPSDRRLSVKLMPTFADRGCHVVSVTNPHGRILGFLDRSRYFSSK
jgi:hypothetical protein